MSIDVRQDHAEYYKRQQFKKAELIDCTAAAKTMIAPKSFQEDVLISLLDLPVLCVHPKQEIEFPCNHDTLLGLANMIYHGHEFGTAC